MIRVWGQAGMFSVTFISIWANSPIRIITNTPHFDLHCTLESLDARKILFCYDRCTLFICLCVQTAICIFNRFRVFPMQFNKPCNILFRPQIYVGNVPLARLSLFVAIGFNQVSAFSSVNCFPPRKHCTS